MPQETPYDQKSLPKVQMWAAYNHMPGGQIVAIHFEDNIRTKKIGDQMQNLLFTAKEQIEAFEKSPNVAINIKGQITKNKVIVYNGSDLKYNPKAADVVIAWAKGQGLLPIETKNDREPKGFERDKRLDAVESSVADLKSTVNDLAGSVRELVAGFSKK